jgi:hypothetical protein
MRIRRLLILAAGFFFAVSNTAGAQEAGKVGVTIAYPASIGLIWHATDKVAIRPAFAFAHSDSEITNGTSENESTTIALDLGVLFYLKKYDNVRTYISPRFVYSRSTSTSTPVSTVPGLPELSSTGTSTGGAGVFGVQYTPGARFSVFGEVGMAYSHRHTETESGVIGALKSNGWATTSGVGVIFYF